MSRFPSNEQPKSTYESNCITKTFLEMYVIEEQPNGTLPLKLTSIDHYQREDTVIKDK